MIKRWIILAVCVFSMPSTLLGNDFEIFQTWDGQVIILGADDISEIISVRQVDENTLNFFVYSIGTDGFVDAHAYENYDDVTGVYVDFGEGRFDGYQHLLLGIVTGQNAGPVFIDGSVECYCPQQDNFCAFYLGAGSVVTGDVVVETNRQDDLIIVDNATIMGDVNIKSKNGEDLIRFTDVEVGGSIYVNSGNANDTIELTDVDISGHLNIQSKRANDELEIQSCWIGRSTFIDLGLGDDETLILNSSFGVSTLINGGSDVDEGNEAGNSYSKGKGFGGFELGNMSN